MSIHRNKKRSAFTFEFDKIVNGERVRVTKSLPKSWNQAQADAYDRQESAKLYALATRVERANYTIGEAVAKYIKERVPKLKSGENVAEELGRLLPYYQGRPIEALLSGIQALIRSKDGVQAVNLRNADLLCESLDSVMFSLLNDVNCMAERHDAHYDETRASVGVAHVQ